MPLKQDSEQDQYNPAERYHSDERRNLGSLKELSDREQQAAADRDTLADMERPENYSRDGRNAADKLNDTESNPMGYAPGETVSRRSGKQKLTGKAMGGRFGRKGPMAALISLLVGGGAAFSVFLAPGMGIIHFKEMLSDKLNDQLPAVNVRTNALLRDKLNNNKAMGFCSSKVNIHCKFSTSSKKQIANFEKAGFKIDVDPNKPFGGRERIVGITFPDDGPRVSDPGELQRLLRNQPRLQAQLYRAYFPKSASLSNKFSKSVARVFNRYGISKASVFSGSSKEGFDTQLRESTSGQDAKDKINNARDPAGEDDTDGQQGQTDADSNVDKMTTDKPLSMDDVRVKGIGALGVVQSACSAYTMANLVEGGAKTYRALQLVQFAQNLILNPADKIKAGDSTPAETEYIGNKITLPDMRKEILNPEKDDGSKITNPAYGKSAMDSPIFKAFAYNDAVTLPYRSAQFMTGGGLVSKVSNVIDDIEQIGGGKQNVRQTCRVVNSPFGTAISFAGMFVPGAGLAAAVAGTVVGGLIEMIVIPILAQQLVNYISGKVVDDSTANVDIGDAVSSGTSQMLGAVAQTRGLTPMGADGFNEYLAYTEDESQQMIAALKEEAKTTPFDVSNQYSFLGMFSRAITPSMLTARTSAIGAFQIVPSFVSTSLATISSSVNASTPIDPARFDKCTDEGYAEMSANSQVDFNADIACNVRFGMTPEELNIPNQQLIQHMIDTGQIKEDDMSGAPIEGSEYAKWVEGCPNREAWGVYYEDIEKEDLRDGSGCISAENREMYKYFSAFHLNNSLADDMELEEVPRETSGGGDSTPNENSGNVNPNGWAFPTTKGAQVSSPLGPRGGGYHTGIDLNVSSGQPFYATRAGTVEIREYDIRSIGGGAWCPVTPSQSYVQKDIWIRHDDNGQQYTSVYAHMSEYSVKNGDKVEAGDLIGKTGGTGCSSGPHVHFEIWKGHSPNPSVASPNALDPWPLITGGN